MNTSKVRDKRFWDRWRAAGAIGTAPPSGERLIQMGKDADYILSTFTKDRVRVAVSEGRLVYRMPPALHGGYRALLKTITKERRPSPYGVEAINTFFAGCSLKLNASIPEEGALSVRGKDWPNFLRFVSVIAPQSYDICAQPR
jgi:hypothetical protein